MSDLTPERLAEIERALRLDRCAWCGWPVQKIEAEGCTEGNCSMRPRPGAAEADDLHNDLRTLIRMALRALELEHKLKAMESQYARSEYVRRADDIRDKRHGS